MDTTDCLYGCDHEYLVDSNPTICMSMFGYAVVKSLQETRAIAVAMLELSYVANGEPEAIEVETLRQH